MASISSPSSSSQRRTWKYDVFLSFRGKDTRNTFTSHLYKALDRAGIVTFQDDKRLEHGSSISEELLKAIEDSQYAIIVFSNNYASSRWTLDELVKIMKCKDEFELTVIPVFYDVAATIIRNQKESFAEAFAKHELKYKNNVEGMQKVQGWRTALNAAADLSGHDIRDRVEADCIQEIVDEINFKLCKSIPSCSLQDVVGISTHVDGVKSILEEANNEVRIIGIWGMGGIGKTTIAKAVFDTISYKFEAACFLEGVKETKIELMHSLQNSILSELLRENRVYVNSKERGKDLMAKKLCQKKVLIVLDDIDHVDHLEYLAGDLGWFGKGSRVIVTTRNKHLIGNDDVIYTVPTLPDHEAIQVLTRYAFKKEVPDKCFEKFLREVVNHAKGLPLALKVWGCLLHKKGKIDWERAIEQMKNTANLEIVVKLRISYDGLDPIQQQMFLDIACFFRGYDVNSVMPILESCFGFNIGLSVLIEKALLFISKDNKIEMHDLIQDMGKDVGKCSRLWLVEDVEEVMLENAGTETVEAIWILDPPDLQISNNALEKMSKLRMLGLECTNYPGEGVGTISFHDETFKYLSNKLSYLRWDFYPLESLPANFKPKKLVHLELRGSKLHHLWTGTKNFVHLRWLDLSFSRNLIVTPDFTGMPKLEELDLQECSDLEEVHPTLKFCSKLRTLDMTECKSLKRFPYVNVESLEYLDLAFCSSLEKFPEILGEMKLELQIFINFTGIRELPSAFVHRTHITSLNLSGLENLVTLPQGICKLKNLKFLYVYDCFKLESLPEEIGDLDSLEYLNACRTLISRPPLAIIRLNKLESLLFGKQKSKEDQPTAHLSQSTAHFVFPRVNEGLRSLEMLNLYYCKLEDGGLPEDFGCLSSLKRLYLEGNNLVHLPQSITQLGALEVLDVSSCKRLIGLPELPPNVEELRADYHVAHSIQNYENLKVLILKLSSVVIDHSISDLFALTLLKCILSVRKAQRVFYMLHPATEIPIWFKYHRKPEEDLLVKLPENWYADGNFLGFAISYLGSSNDSIVELIPLSNDGKSQKLSKELASPSYSRYKNGVNFYFIPLATLWDTSTANGKTPNDYGHLKFSIPYGEMGQFGFRLLYKYGPELEALLEMKENNDKPIELCNGINRSRYSDGEPPDFVTNEASCSSNKRHRASS